MTSLQEILESIKAFKKDMEKLGVFVEVSIMRLPEPEREAEAE